MHGQRRRPSRVRGARPRYRRITAAASAASVTVVAVLGAVGILPTGSASGAAFAAAGDVVSRAARQGIAPSIVPSGSLSPNDMRLPDPRDRLDDDELPKDSGEGRRVVFDISAQRVWLVSARDQVRRTYLVSGSVTDNLSAGSYEVYSKSLDAVGIDDSGTMKYMVRFAHGERAAIGFHDIPVQRGERVQTRKELGTPQSHGCIRQWRPDARALWDFAPIGTKVVVVD